MERTYAAERIRSIAQRTAAAIKPDVTHTNEVFAAFRAAGVKPETPTQYWKRVREMAKAREIYTVPAPTTTGSRAAFEKIVDGLYASKVDAAAKRKVQILDEGDRLADAVVLTKTLDPLTGVRQMTQYARSALSNNSAS